MKPKTGITLKPNSINSSKNRDQLVLYIWSLGFRYCLGFRDYNLEFPKFRSWRIYGFLQNEPNFRKTLSKLRVVIADSYNEKKCCQPKITNPIRTQYEPNRTQFQPKNSPTNQIRTQSEPNSKYKTPNQIKVDFQRIRCTIIQAYKESIAKGFNNAI